MEYSNRTPFPTLLFTSRNVEQRPFHVFVLRGTFDIVANGALTPRPKQQPLSFQDTYVGEPGASSPYADSDIAPFKPRSDVLVHAVAHAPSGLPAPSWLARIQVGRLDKTLRVTGPRAWEKDEAGAWQLSEPEPCTEVPIRYENAFGGVWKTQWESAACKENPLGRGYVSDSGEPESPWPAPQIESPDDPIAGFDRAYRPEGLGPMGRPWAPRHAKSGTMDAAWQAERCPALPLVPASLDTFRPPSPLRAANALIIPGKDQAHG